MFQTRDIMIGSASTEEYIALSDVDSLYRLLFVSEFIDFKAATEYLIKKFNV